MDYNLSKGDTERLFLAVKLPSDLQQIIAEECSTLSQTFQFAKWTYPEDYHITLQFLGDTPKEKIPALIQSLEQIVGQCSPFKLTMDQWDTFGLPASPRVLWIGVSGEVDSLRDLYSSVLSATNPLGFSPEAREYKPHLTVARKYKGIHSFDEKILKYLLKLDGEKRSKSFHRDWTVDSFVLYATRIYAIPMYESIAKFYI